MTLFLRILLAIHLCGLAVMAGTTTVDYFTFKTFCNLADAKDTRAQGLLPIMARYGELVRLGAAILIVSGVTMLVVEKGIRWQELWFKIKMGLVVLLVLNGLLVGNRLGLRFRKMTMESNNIRVDLDHFYLVQLALFLLIILLSVIRPNFKNL